MKMNYDITTFARLQLADVGVSSFHFRFGAEMSETEQFNHVLLLSN